MTLLAEGELLVAVHASVDPIVTAVRRTYGPLPSLKTTEFLDANTQVRVAALLVVAEAYVVAEPHQVIRQTLRRAAHDIHAGEVRRWREAAAAASRRNAVHEARTRVVTPVRCTREGCGALLEVGHPLPDLTAVECAAHGSGGVRRAE